MRPAAGPARAIRRLDALEELDLPEPPFLASGDDLRGDYPALPVLGVARSHLLAALERGETRYVDGAGILPLRRAVAQRLSREGVAADPERGMIITGGEQEARFLAIKGLALSGRRLVLPAVVHPGVRKAAALSGIQRSLIPFDLERGVPDLDAARDALRLGPSALYLESPHRLTGRLIPAGDDAALEAIAAEAGALVVRDTGLAGWLHPGTPGQQGGTATRAGVETVWLGTVWTGAGVEGWLIAYLVLPPAVYPEPRRLKQVMAMCTSVPVQWGAFGVLAEGEPEYQHQLRELAAIRARALRAWRGDVFAGDVVTLVAVRLPEALDASRLPRGMPGAAFGAPRAMRFTVTPDAEIVDAMRTLAQAVARGADA